MLCSKAFDYYIYNWQHKIWYFFTVLVIIYIFRCILDEEVCETGPGAKCDNNVTWEPRMLRAGLRHSASFHMTFNCCCWRWQIHYRCIFPSSLQPPSRRQSPSVGNFTNYQWPNRRKRFDYRSKKRLSVLISYMFIYSYFGTILHLLDLQGRWNM